MDPPITSNPWFPTSQNHPNHHHHHSRCHHHHHHHHLFHILPNCRLHSFMLHQNFHSHQPTCPFFNAYLSPRNRQALGTDIDLQFPQTSSIPLVDELDNGEEQLQAEEEEEPIFVLTDEWRDFFAKSEAKRRQAKKQGKKSGKTN